MIRTLLADTDRCSYWSHSVGSLWMWVCSRQQYRTLGLCIIIDVNSPLTDSTQCKILNNLELFPLIYPFACPYAWLCTPFCALTHTYTLIYASCHREYYISNEISFHTARYFCKHHLIVYLQLDVVPFYSQSYNPLTCPLCILTCPLYNIAHSLLHPLHTLSCSFIHPLCVPLPVPYGPSYSLTFLHIPLFASLHALTHYFTYPLISSYILPYITLCTPYGLFTLSETENNFCSETDEMAKSRQCDWLLLAISSEIQKSFSVSLSVRTSL